MTTDPSRIISDINKQMEALSDCTRDEQTGAPFKNDFTDPGRAGPRRAGWILPVSHKTHQGQ
ncbi:hypothetical protein [Methylobacter tundripaludum]|uniref:hypothetical protein n=1 Tax=Methylobacter tundripaludum TaxID=173365 RepID=UPI0001E51BFD|nr:hypothetical protein [Methylobacter tundripaludum]